MKKILVLLATLFTTAAFAADNAVIVTPGVGVTMKSKDIGSGVQAMQPILSDSSGNALSTPTAGADAVSNTSTGLLNYARVQIFNGTTWDRWQGAVTATLAAETTKVIGTVRTASGGIASGSVASGAFASGSIASGAIASGAVASGAYAAGSLAAGAGVDGWDLTQGAIGDAAATQGSTGSISAKLRTVTSQLNTGNASLATIATNSALPLPACAAAPCVTTVGNVGFDPSSGKATPTFKNLSMNTATTTEIIPLSGSTVTYVIHLHIMAGGTANVTFKYGTGTNCGTGTTTLDGPYPLTAQAGISMGSGTGPVMIVPAGKALCITSDAAVQVTTGLTHQQI